MLFDFSSSPFLVPLLAAVTARLMAIFIRRAAAILDMRLWWLANVFALTAASFLGLSFYWAMILGPQRIPGETGTWMLLGQVMIIAGALVTLLGLMEMGPGAFLVTPRSTLISKGLYARIRRPMDAGVLVVSVGAALVQGSPGAWMWSLLWIPLSLALSELEEWELRNRIPAAGAYFDHTPRYLPRRKRHG